MLCLDFAIFYSWWSTYVKQRYFNDSKNVLTYFLFFLGEEVEITTNATYLGFQFLWLFCWGRHYKLGLIRGMGLLLSSSRMFLEPFLGHFIRIGLDGLYHSAHGCVGIVCLSCIGSRLWVYKTSCSTVSLRAREQYNPPVPTRASLTSTSYWGFFLLYCDRDHHMYLF